MTPRSRGLTCGPAQITLLQITTQAIKDIPDFKFELFPLHSPLLGESLLVSFPPLIDMLKFSGQSHLIRGQILDNLSKDNQKQPTESLASLLRLSSTSDNYHAEQNQTLHQDQLIHFRPAALTRQNPNPNRDRNKSILFDSFMTLEQVCSPEYQGAQGAFKDSMIH